MHGPIRLSILRGVTRTYAQTGAHDALERALSEGADLGDRYGWQSTSPFGGTTAFAMSSAYINARRATCHLRNGRYAQAAELLESGTNAYQPGVYRGRSMWHTRHAHALLHAEGPQAALQPALDAVDCLNRATSTRVRHELAQLRAQIPTNSTGSHDLHELLQPT